MKEFILVKTKTTNGKSKVRGYNHNGWVEPVNAIPFPTFKDAKIALESLPPQKGVRIAEVEWVQTLGQVFDKNHNVDDEFFPKVSNLKQNKDITKWSEVRDLIIGTIFRQTDLFDQNDIFEEVLAKLEGSQFSTNKSMVNDIIWEMLRDLIMHEDIIIKDDKFQFVSVV